MVKIKTWGGILLSTATLSALSPAHAQDSSGGTRAASDARDGDIVVTAQKREERLIDVPQSLTVLGSENLEKLGATQFRDFANTVPGLSFTTAGAGYTQVSLRGVTTGFFPNSTVAIYVDDVPYGSSSSFAQGAQLALDVGLFDIDRIEVLRGPQGTLYGSSSMGGLIKYVRKQPSTSEASGEMQAGISKTKHGGVSFNLSGALNVPLATDKAAFRVSAFESRDGGYTDNIALGQKDVSQSDVYGGRADLLLTPTESLTIRVGGFLQRIDREGQPSADYTIGGMPLYGDLGQSRLFKERFNQKLGLLSGSVTYDFGGAELTSISAYQKTDTEVLHDISGVYVPFFPADYSAIAFHINYQTKKFTQEIRLASSGDGPLEWLVGGFYNHESSQNRQVFDLVDINGQPAPNILYDYSGPSSFKEYAGFANLTYHFTDKFDISGGIRFAENRQKFTQIGSGLFIGSQPTRRSSENVVTYLANARYKFSDRATAYARFATGYRPGGPNFLVLDPVTGDPIGPPTFGADTLESYEVGFKAETPGRTFTIDASAYYIDWSNIQILTVRNGFSGNTNAPGGASIRGAELALTARPVPALTLSGAFAYQDAELSEADADLQGAKGERLPNVPRFTATLTGDLALSESVIEPTIGATLRYVSNRRSSFDANVSQPQYRLPGYASLDLRASVVLGPVNLQAYVHNVFDKRGQLSAWTAYSAAGEAQVSLLQPRTFGLLATARF